MDRLEFLASIGVAAAGAVVPSPTPSPSIAPWDECLSDIGLPYDRPLLMKMRSLDGPQFDLAHYRGKALMINLFATWCEPCKREMPAIVQAAAEYRDRGLAVVAINDREADDTVRAFRKKYAIDFPIAMDETGGLFYSIEHGAKYDEDDVTFPATLFVDPAGYLYCYVSGSMPAGELRYRIERFLTYSAPGIVSPSPSPSEKP